MGTGVQNEFDQLSTALQGMDEEPESQSVHSWCTLYEVVYKLFLFGIAGLTSCWLI